MHWYSCALIYRRRSEEGFRECRRQNSPVHTYTHMHIEGGERELMSLLHLSQCLSSKGSPPGEFASALAVISLRLPFIRHQTVGQISSLAIACPWHAKVQPCSFRMDNPIPTLTKCAPACAGNMQCPSFAPRGHAHEKEILGRPIPSPQELSIRKG